MDPFTFATRKVTNSDIPDAILHDAFITRKMRLRRSSKSVEECIVDEVIRKRVMPDLTCFGGTQLDLDLNGLYYDTMPNYQRIYTIPLNRTLNRPIIQALIVHLNVTSNFAERQPGQNISNFYTTPIERSAKRVINSWRPIPNVSNAHVEIIGDNVIKVRDYQNFSPDSTLRCLVALTDDFSELKRAYYEDFARLVCIATKAYIFRNLSLEVDQAKLDGGRELGRYREFLDEYHDAYQTYQDLLDSKWGKILILNDQQRNDNHIIRAGSTRV